MAGGRTQKAQHLHFAPRPRRRKARRVVVGVIVLAVLLAAAAVVKAAVATTPDLTIKGVLTTQVVLPGSPPLPAWPAQGEAAVEVVGLPPLGSSGGVQPLPIASLAKVMTAYVVLQDHPMQAGQPGFTASIDAADVADYNARLAQSESVVPVTPGETLTELQLLQGLLVASGNNFASVLARRDAGSVKAFVAKMQATAASLNMSHTAYTDPSGVEPTTVSTAGDQLVLAGRAMSDPVFAQIVDMTQVDLPVAGTATNFNTAIGKDGFIGIKTGSDSASGGCLLFANRQAVDGHTFTILGAVLGQGAGSTGTTALVGAAVAAATSLVRSVAAAIKQEAVLPAGTVAASISDGTGRTVQATTTQALWTLGFGGMTIPLTVSLNQLGTTLNRGQVVGRVGIQGGGSADVKASAALSSPSFSWKLRHDY